MDIHSVELHNIAKKYKRLFESYSINAGGCLINNHEFYWVNYYRLGKMVGHAVISPNEVMDKDEYKQAFHYLARSSQIRANLSTNGGFRARINMESFRIIERFLDNILLVVDEEDKQVVSKCLGSIQSNLNLQDRIVEIYNSFHQKEEKIQKGEVKFCTDEYLEFTLDCLWEIEYLQYTQFTLQYDAIPLLEYIKKLTNKNRNVKKLVSSEINLYLKEFIKSKDSLFNSIKNLTFHPEIAPEVSKDRHMTLARDTLLKSIEEVTNEALKDLRFPKLVMTERGD
ncbi:hypothetical protein [Ornithinibacillus halotolerans]|uniref:Uncharacterized protein n=1 Tax=Ornithinibacillus halotolerans TaxID=1274357 RepID=A0A916WAZ0_9BACI|nr:hypothetical protein [Ornithinibacillus halotolerans]GGA81474.1 hypothetical protein GCM10008025_25990 [Ornithinibacillus halotolerans]